MPLNIVKATRLTLYAGREVQARQQLNCEHAMSQCRDEGLAWLLHVDSDELLYLPGRLSVRWHERRRGVRRWYARIRRRERLRHLQHERVYR